MVWAIICGVVGLAMAAFGALSVAAAFMPRFGGGSDDWALPVGVVLMIAGVSLIFYAGTLA